MSVKKQINYTVSVRTYNQEVLDELRRISPPHAIALNERGTALGWWVVITNDRSIDCCQYSRSGDLIMSIDRYTWREIELTLDDDTIFTFPLKLTKKECDLLREIGLPILAERERLSDIDDIENTAKQLLYVGPNVGQGEEEADDLYRKCMRIWEAWDRR